LIDNQSFLYITKFRFSKKIHNTTAAQRWFKPRDYIMVVGSILPSVVFPAIMNVFERSFDFLVKTWYWDYPKINNQKLAEQNNAEFSRNAIWGPSWPGCNMRTTILYFQWGSHAYLLWTWVIYLKNVLSIKTILFDILDFWCQLEVIRFVKTLSKRRMFVSFMKILACWLLHRLITLIIPGNQKTDFRNSGLNSQPLLPFNQSGFDRIGGAVKKNGSHQQVL